MILYKYNLLHFFFLQSSLSFIEFSLAMTALTSQTSRTIKGVKIKDTEFAATGQKQRQVAAKVSHSFMTREFSPFWYATNPHIQTIMGTLYRSETMYDNFSDTNKAIKTFKWDKRQRMETVDGDFFDVDWKFSNSGDNEAPLVLVCHGLESSSASPLAKDMSIAFNNIGMDTACLNFRGCSGEINRTERGYHLGFTNDLKQMIDYVNSKWPKRHIYLSGFSLGANVVTKFLADVGDNASQFHVYGAAVNAVPFDMTKTYKNVNSIGVTKTLYADRLLKSLTDRLQDAYDKIEFSFPFKKIRECKTIMDFENLMVAPIFGFKDAMDYYEKCSTIRLLYKISVPQLIVQALDDPFFDGNINPPNNPEWPLRIHYTKYGGHCGFVFHNDREGAKRVSSWMPTELASYLLHVEENLSATSNSELSTI